MYVMHCIVVLVPVRIYAPTRLNEVRRVNRLYISMTKNTNRIYDAIERLLLAVLAKCSWLSRY